MELTHLVLGVILCSMFLFGTLINGWAAYILIFAAGIPLAITFIVPNAMVADIAEWDGLVTGQRREGMFFGAQGLIIKIVIGISSLVTPFIFDIFGYTKDNPLGLKLIGPIAGIIALAGIFFIRRYGLTEQQLEDRKRLTSPQKY